MKMHAWLHLTIVSFLIFNTDIWQQKSVAATGTTSYVEEKSKTDLARMNLKGNLQSYVELNYKGDSSTGKIERVEFTGQVTRVFSKAGYETEISQFSASGKRFSASTFAYDEKNNILQNDHFGLGDIHLGSIVYTYNEKKQLITEEDSRPDYLIKKIYTYDAAGNKRDETVWRKGEYSGKTSFVYNTKNQLISESEKADFVLYDKISYTYDSKGNEIGDSRDVAGEVGFQTHQRKYNAAGMLIEENGFQSGKPSTSISYQYDKEGNLIRAYYIFIDGKKSDDRYTYTYDAKGNWTSRIRTYHGLIFISDRTLTYY